MTNARIRTRRMGNTHTGSDKIREAVLALSEDPNRQYYSEICVVNSVDTAARTCIVTPINGKAEISDVRFAPSTTEDPALLPVPAIDSTVLVDFYNDSEAFIAMFSAVDSLIIRTTSGNVLQLQNGSDGGLVKVVDLTSKLNAIENKVNTIIDALKNSAVLAGDGGATYKAAITVAVGSNLTTTVRGDIENEKVTHGE